MANPAYLMVTSPPVGGAANTITVNSNTYTCAPGDFVSAAFADVPALLNAGWATNGEIGGGPTANRPTSVEDGTTYFDTTIGALVTFDANTGDNGVWRNGAGAIV